MNHRAGAAVFGIAVGLAVALLAYQWITDPDRRADREREEQVVAAARLRVSEIVAAGDLEIVDPLAPDRKVGKVYVYAEPPGWAVSGYYRRNDADRWHPFLATLNEDLALVRLKLRDPALAGHSDPRVTVTD